MTPERWQQIDQLFEQALQQPPERRAAFLAGACAGDDDLRRRLEAMLVADQSEDDLLDQPAYAAAANLIEAHHSSPAAGQTEISLGQKIGGYRLISQIGRGGMGEVYLAEDTRMGRRVALKLLPRRLTGDAERVRRFQREARAASALNHPNILTIYDFGQHDGQHYIATEFVEGRTLRALIREGRLKLPQAVDVAIQMASALAAAHAGNIVHRDIKPENVMLRPDGYVKVLDFGLAKLIEQSSSDKHSSESAATRASGGSAFETRTGAILGTVTYMSPEQARGQKVDTRTDIFSLGVVLYEMATGQRPFGGATRNHVLVAILDTDPPPISQHAPDAPPQLQQIINRTLAKERERRFQSAGELLDALREMKEELISAEHALRVRTGELQNGNTTASNEAAGTSAVSAFVGMTRRKALATVVALVALAAFAAVMWFGWRGDRTPPFAKMRLSRLSVPSESSSGIISPDGKYVLYIAGEPGNNSSLRLKQLGGGGEVELTPPAAVVFIRIAFSPDSNFVYYSTQDVPGQLAGTLYRLPIIGGAQPQKVPAKTAFPVSHAISPDGQQILISRRGGLIVANLNDGAERSLLNVPENSNVDGSAWTRDGAQVVYSVRERHPGRGIVHYLAARPAKGGEERIVLPRQPGDFRNLACLPGRRGLLVVMPDTATGLYQLYHVTYDGAVRRLTQDLNDYVDVTVTDDGRTAALVYQEQVSNLRVAPLDAPQRAAPLANWSGVINAFVWLRDGRILYSQTDNNTAELWQIAFDGSRPTQLTTAGGINNYPTASTDGRFIVFSSTRTGREEVWRMEADGGRLTQLTTQGGSRPQVSPDGRWIVYESQDPQRQSLWKLPLEGGPPAPLTNDEMRNPAISPDGKWVACEKWEEAKRKWLLAVVPFEGDAPARVFDAVVGYGKLRWANDGQGVIFLEGHSAGFSQLVKLQPLDGSPARILFSIGKDTLFWFDLSPDGKQIAYRAGRQIMPTALLTEIE